MLPPLVPLASFASFVLLLQSPPAGGDLAADRAFRAEFKGAGPPFAIESVEPGQVQSIEQATKQGGLDADDIVLGLTIGKSSRAYPIRTIATSEVINDQLGDAPIAITWCKACHAAVIYDRRLGEQTLTIGNYRSTWNKSMVLYDVETGSLWVQAVGEARAGPLRGRALEPYVASTTTWGQWCAEHPDTTVAINDWRRGTTRATNHLFDERATVKLGILAREGRASRFFPLDEFSSLGVVCDEVAKVPIVVLYSRKRRVMQVFRRDVAGKAIELAFAAAGAADPKVPLLLEEVGSSRRWRADTGLPEPADAAWPPLERVIAYPLRMEHFRDLFPAVTVWEPAPADPPKSGD